MRTLLLLGGGALAVFGSEKIGYEGAGPLGVIFAALVGNYYWCQQGCRTKNVGDNIIFIFVFFTRMGN